MAQPSRLWGGFGDLGRFTAITQIGSSDAIPSSVLSTSVGNTSSSFSSASAFDISYKRNRPPKVIHRKDGEDEGYAMGDVLGSGSYGKVRVAADRSTGRVVAIKIINKRYLKRIRGGEDSIKNEIKNMKYLQSSGKPHPNIVELIEVITKEEKEKIYMVLEMVTGGSVQQLLELAQEKERAGRLPQNQARKIFQQLITALDYMHSRGIVHRDIKPTNIMLTPDLRVKISDFGVSERLKATESSDVVTKFSGSPAFLPPEIATGKEGFSGAKIDIWAAGITLFLMLTGKIPFEGNSVGELFDRIAQGQIDIPESVEDPDCRDLLAGMLRYKEEERFTLEQIKTHRWMQKEASEDAKEPWVRQNADSEPLRRLWEKLYNESQSASPAPAPAPPAERERPAAAEEAEGESMSAREILKKPAQMLKNAFSGMFADKGPEKR
eukprot:tig00000093_g3473.t1